MAASTLGRAGDRILDGERRLYGLQPAVKRALAAVVALAYAGLGVAASTTTDLGMRDAMRDAGFVVAAGTGAVFGSRYGLLAAAFVLAIDAVAGSPLEPAHAILLLVLGAICGRARSLTERLAVERGALDRAERRLRERDRRLASVVDAAHREVALTRERLGAVIESAPVILFALDADGRFTLSEGRGLDALGLRSGEVLGKSVFELFADVPIALEAVRRALAGEETSAPLTARGVAFEARYVPVREADGSVSGLIGVALDVTARERARRELERLAHYDALTGLPNRNLLSERIARAAATVASGGAPFALLLVDVDRFRELNDALGHRFGDEVLKEVGSRLREVIGVGDTVARLGNDEFALVLPGRDAAKADALARGLRSSLARSLRVEGQLIDVAATIGIVVAPDHGNDPATLLRRVEIATAAAKRSGRGFALFLPEQDGSSPARIALTAELREAIERGALELHYQPVVGAADGRPVGLEALARWQHPVRGSIPPAEFVALAEQTGLMRALTEWVLGEACRQHAAWLAAGVPLEIAVNISARNLADPDFVGYVERITREHGFATCPLRFEITESTIMADPERSLRNLTRLRELGVRISIDDFGTGHSSLAYLHRLPVDAVKVDRSFVATLRTSAPSRAIVRSIVELGRALGLEVLAEGVEDRETWARLIGLGCSAIQGYAVRRPAPAAEIEAWLRSARGLAA